MFTVNQFLSSNVNDTFINNAGTDAAATVYMTGNINSANIYLKSNTTFDNAILLGLRFNK